MALSSRYQVFRKEKEEAIKRALQIQKEANETLEQKVAERTNQLSLANEELNVINDELENTIELVEEQKENLNRFNEELNATLELVSTQKHEIEIKNRDITSSINYAKRIQTALLPEAAKLKRALPEHFIFLKPRDIVSGDFYWFMESEDKVFLAAADCTGHGVPGAFMSVIGDVLLNQIVSEQKITSPDLILNHLHKGVQKILRQNETENRDGMEIALCVIDYKTGVLNYAGAMSSLYFFRNGESTELKGDRCSIGGVQLEENRIFTLHSIEINEPLAFYIFSDGYKDQFGGPDGRKFMSKKFKEMLAEIHRLPSAEQRQKVEGEIVKWAGDKFKQTDDMLVIGFKLTPEMIRTRQKEETFAKGLIAPLTYSPSK